MVKAIVDINEEANKTIKSQEVLEPELKPEFINELLKAQKEKTIKVKTYKT